jgi:diguanylate cyclase (GGDEF)-like protein
VSAEKGGRPLGLDNWSTLLLVLAVGLVAGWVGRGLRKSRPTPPPPHPDVEEDLARVVPDALRRLFAAANRRAVGPVALGIVEELLKPEQCAYFHARPADRRLSLAIGHGLPPDASPGLEIEYGEGRPGYVAQEARLMAAGDFDALPEELRARLPACGPAGLRVDVGAPVVDEAGDLTGVLIVAGVRDRRGREKRLVALLSTLTGLVVTHVTRLRATQQIADLDALTGTYTKRVAHQRLAEQMASAEQARRPLSLLLLDIDHFKLYNDTHGHLEGDAALRQVGHVLSASIREDDTAARYGGDEFLVLLPGAGKERARSVAEHLRRTVEGLGLDLTLSAGVATYPEDAGSGVSLMRAADQALYEAKAAGRNRVVTAGPERTS